MYIIFNESVKKSTEYLVHNNHTLTENIICYSSRNIKIVSCQMYFNSIYFKKLRNVLTTYNLQVHNSSYEE